MFNAVNKRLCRNVASLLAVVALAGCSGSKNADTGDQDAAAALLGQARAEASKGDYEASLTLLDSLNTAYPKAIEVRKEALEFEKEIRVQATQREIEICDSLLAIARVSYEDSKKAMRLVENSNGLEPYWIAREGNAANFMESTGIQARVYNNGSFNIISEVNGAGNLHHTSITLTAPDGESASSGYVPYDGEINFRLNNSETVTFSSEKADAIGLFALEHRGQSLSLTFNGDNGRSKKITLTPRQVDGIAAAYHMAQCFRDGQQLELSREQLQRKLELASRQAAK